MNPWEMKKLEPVPGLEPGTDGLQNRMLLTQSNKGILEE